MQRRTLVVAWMKNCRELIGLKCVVDVGAVGTNIRNGNQVPRSVRQAMKQGIVTAVVFKAQGEQ